jgi:hypothetical protein
MEITTLVAALVLLPVLSGAAAAKEKPPARLPDGATLALPKLPGVSAEWPILPGTLKKLSDRNLRFHVAPNGKVCLVAGERVLFYPELELSLTAQVPIQELLWLAKGNMLVHSGQRLGFLKIDADNAGQKAGGKKKGTLTFSSLFKVPYKQSRLFAGVGDAFYLVGRNEKENRDEISAWDLADAKAPVKPLYATDAPINAVAGSPERTYFAAGRVVFMLDKGATAAKSVYVHAREDIRELIYRPDVGLFFTTADSVGYIGEKEQFEFLAYPGVQLRLGGKSLYVRLGAVGNGILRISGPERFAELRLDPPRY